MKWLRSVIAAAILVMVAVPAVGQNVRFAGTPDARIANGYYVGPYALQIPPVTGPIVDAYCVDFLNAVSWNQEWTADFSVLSDETAVENQTRVGLRGFGAREAQERYAAAAWLTRSFNDDYDWGVVHATIWNIMTPDSPDPDAWGASADLASAAFANSQSVNLDNWMVVTDERATGLYGGTQEFLVNVNVVPEPATIILMGTGLMAVMGMTVVMRRSVG